MAFTPAELEGTDVSTRTVVALDVLRATSTIVHALVNGARAVLPVVTVEQAMTRVKQIGPDGVVLGGERGSRRIEGFQLGNSPSEYTVDVVAGKTLVMTTTNGTRALVAGEDAQRCLVASLCNIGAVCGELAREGGDVLLLCAGRESRFALEDAVCAGLIARRLSAAGRAQPWATNDAAKVAMYLARRFGSATERLLPRTAAGRELERLGFGDDVAFCARVDRYEVVPRLEDSRVIL